MATHDRMDILFGPRVPTGRACRSRQALLFGPQILTGAVKELSLVRCERLEAFLMDLGEQLIQLLSFFKVLLGTLLLPFLPAAAPAIFARNFSV